MKSGRIISPRALREPAKAIQTRTLIKFKLLGKEVQIDTTVDLAVAFEYVQTGILHKLLLQRPEEDITLQNLLSQLQLCLSGTKVALNVKSLDELGDGVCVLVGLLLDGADQFLQLILLLLVGNNSDGKESENVRASHLNSAQVAVVEEPLNDTSAARRVVEEDEQGPVNEPCALLELLKGSSEALGVNNFAESVEGQSGGFPLLHKDLSAQNTPKSSSGQLAIVRKITEVGQVPKIQKKQGREQNKKNLNQRRVIDDAYWADPL
jgi:hypothetical protein